MEYTYDLKIHLEKQNFYEAVVNLVGNDLLMDNLKTQSGKAIPSHFKREIQIYSNVDYCTFYNQQYQKLIKMYKYLKI
jgi:hypothetical protein